MAEKEKIMVPRKEVRPLLYTVLALVLFAIIGQAACDRLGTLKGGARQWLMIAFMVFEILVLSVTVLFLSGKGRITRILAWIAGVLAFLYMFFIAFLLLFAESSPIEIYGAGWWVGRVDKLKEEQRLWSSSHWVGPGDSYYEYDDSVVEIPAETEAQSMEEPYRSAFDERARAEVTYRYYYSDTMINVLSYLYGRWIWLIYLTIAIVWIVAGVRASCLVCGIPSKLLYFASWLLFSIAIWLPALNGCGRHFFDYGPPFTGFSRAYLEYNLLVVGPPLGVISALVVQNSFTCLGHTRPSPVGGNPLQDLGRK